jgi:hypothetical protein
MLLGYLSAVAAVITGASMGLARWWWGVAWRLALTAGLFFLMGFFVHVGLPMVDSAVAALSGTTQK